METDGAMKRVVAIGDLHCGHKAGLTPPQWMFQPNSGENKRDHFSLIQHTMWEWYSAVCKALQPVDLLIVNGDAIDGKGEASGGTELLTSDRREQSSMAVVCIKEMHAKKIVMSYGTGYHTGKEEDWEDVIASEVCASISGHDWRDVNGLVIDYKHFVSSSVIPYGRHTAVARDKMWNREWSVRGGQPDADLFLRSHVHYFNYAGGPDKMMMTLPSMLVWTKYGSRKFSGVIDTGIVCFDVKSKTDYTWESHLMSPKTFAQEVIKI
jgi:hypothetical protein